MNKKIDTVTNTNEANLAVKASMRGLLGKQLFKLINKKCVDFTYLGEVAGLDENNDYIVELYNGSSVVFSRGCIQKALRDHEMIVFDAMQIEKTCHEFDDCDEDCVIDLIQYC